LKPIWASKSNKIPKQWPDFFPELRN